MVIICSKIACYFIFRYENLYNVNYFEFFKIIKVFKNRPLSKNNLFPRINQLSLILIGSQMIKIKTKMINFRMKINKMNPYCSIKNSIFAGLRAFPSIIIKQAQNLSIKIKIIYQAN